MPRRMASGLSGAVVGAVLLLAGLVAFVDLVITGGSDAAVAGAVLSAVGAFFLVYGVRTCRCAVVAGDDGLLVRNIPRTHRVRWSEIASIRAPDPHAREAFGAVRLQLTDGRSIPCGALNVGISRSAEVRAMQIRHRERLEQLLDRATDAR